MPSPSIGKLLTSGGFISEQDWQTVQKVCGAKPGEIIKGIISLGVIDEEALKKLLASKAGATTVDGPLISQFDQDVLEHIDPMVMQKLEIVPLKIRDDEKLCIAVSDPTDKGLLRQIEFFTGRNVVPVVASTTQINSCLETLIDGYEATKSGLQNFVSHFVATETAGAENAEAAQSAQDADDYFSDLEISEDEDEMVTGSDDLDLSSLSDLDGDEEELDFALEEGDADDSDFGDAFIDDSNALTEEQSQKLLGNFDLSSSEVSMVPNSQSQAIVDELNAMENDSDNSEQDSSGSDDLETGVEDPFADSTSDDSLGELTADLETGLEAGELESVQSDDDLGIDPDVGESFSAEAEAPDLNADLSEDLQMDNVEEPVEDSSNEDNVPENVLEDSTDNTDDLVADLALDDNEDLSADLESLEQDGSLDDLVSDAAAEDPSEVEASLEETDPQTTEDIDAMLDLGDVPTETESLAADTPDVESTNIQESSEEASAINPEDDLAAMLEVSDASEAPDSTEGDDLAAMMDIAEDASPSPAASQGDIDEMMAAVSETESSTSQEEPTEGELSELMDEVDASLDLESPEDTEAPLEMSSTEDNEQMDPVAQVDLESDLPKLQEDDSENTETEPTEIQTETEKAIESSEQTDPTPQKDLVRDLPEETQTRHNLTNIGLLNRALMNLQLTKEVVNAGQICQEALSLVFQKGLIFRVDLEGQFEKLVAWNSHEDIEVAPTIADNLAQFATNLKDGWNSDLSFDGDTLPWVAEKEVFVYQITAEKLGQVIWISESQNPEVITTGITTTCRQFLQKYVSLLTEVIS